MKVFYSPDYFHDSGPATTTRKARMIAEHLEAYPITGMEIVAPTPATPRLLSRTHDSVYVNDIRRTKAWRSVSASTGGALAAGLDAYASRQNAGSLSSGLHHARWDRECGFCTFNGLVVAAQALEAIGATPLILDLDAHCGGGTNALLNLHRLPTRHIDISVSPFDGYESRDYLRLVTRSDRYLWTIKTALNSDLTKGIDVVLYNAGMDPYEHDPVGGLAGITTDLLFERECLVFDWARKRGIPVAFVLAGGYVSDESTLIGLHRMTVEAAAS